MKMLKCLQCEFTMKIKSYQIPECGIIELKLIADIHFNTFKHKMEIIDA